MNRFLANVFMIFVFFLVFVGVSRAETACQGAFLPPAERLGFDFRIWAELPICCDGRIMPLDAFARTHVRMICGREVPRIQKRKFQASELLFAWIAEPEVWWDVPFLRLDDVKLRQWMELPLVDELGERQTMISPRALSELYASSKFTEKWERLEEKLQKTDEKEEKEERDLLEKLSHLENRYVTWLRLAVNPAQKMTAGSLGECGGMLRDSAYLPYMGQIVPLTFLEKNMVYMFCNSYEPRLSLYGVVRENIGAEELVRIQNELRIPERPDRKFSPHELYASLRREPKLWKYVPFLYLEDVNVRKLIGLPTAKPGEMPIQYVSPMELVKAMQAHSDVFQKAFATLPEETQREMSRLDRCFKVYCYWLDGQFFQNIPLGHQFYSEYDALRQAWLDAYRALSQMSPHTDAPFQDRLRGMNEAFEAVERLLTTPLNSRVKEGEKLETAPERLALLSRKLAELRRASETLRLAMENFCRNVPPQVVVGEWVSTLKIYRLSLKNLSACLASLQYQVFDEDFALYLLPTLEGVALDRNRTGNVQVFSQYLELKPQPWMSLNVLRFADLDTGLSASWTPESRLQLGALRNVFREMTEAWCSNQPERFQTACVQFRTKLRSLAESTESIRAQLIPESEMDIDALVATRYPVTDADLRLETFYNRFRPFTWAWVFPFASVFVLGSSVFLRILERKAQAKETTSSPELVCVFHKFGALSFWLGIVLLTLGIVASTVGLALRSQIMHRAPVTNMFETIIFVAWSAGVLGLCLTFRVQLARIIALGWNAVKFSTVKKSDEKLENDVINLHFRLVFWTLRILLAVVFFWFLSFYGLGNGNGYTALNLVPVRAIGAPSPSLSAWVEWLTGLVMLGAFLWWVPLLLLAPVAGAVRYWLKNKVEKSEADADFIAKLERQRYQSPFFAWATAFVVFVISYISVSFPDVFKPDLRNLMPVLRDNYWLAVHVITIVASYGAGMLAWGLANGALFCYIFGRYSEKDGKRQPPEICTTLTELLYRCMQAAVLLLVVGTILGGLWADVSWGRFWSWDRKEVWALISLFVYLLILHGRYIRLLGEFTLAIGAVLGAFAIVMAWYGVNYVMGSALHGYGAGSGSLIYAWLIVGLNLLLICCAIIRYVLKIHRQ